MKIFCSQSAISSHRLAAFCCSLMTCLVATTAPIQFEGVPVEMTITQVSDSTVRLQLAPLDEKGHPKEEITSPALVPLSAFNVRRVRELTGSQAIRAGNFRV